jgi:carbon monoxide dehydrogenase subunit G
VELSGTTSYDSPRQAVWDALTDVDSLVRCAPGGGRGATIQRLDEHHARVQARLGGGLFAANLVVDLELIDLAAPDRAMLSATGQAAGTRLTGSTSLTLSGPPEGPTRVDWTADVQLSGTFAAMGEQLLRGSAAPTIEQALDCVGRQLAPTAG